MRIVFMGNPEFAIQSLAAIHHSKHDLVGVVTNPEKEQGRGRRAKPTPVSRYARAHDLFTIQPDSLKDDDFLSDLTKLEPDLFAVVAFKILSEEILGIPPSGSVNLHGSLLPKYRGAAPIHWALMNGDSRTGLTTFLLAPKVDTGDVFLKKEVIVFPDEDCGSLSRRMSHLGASLLMKTIDVIEARKFKAIPQDSPQATRAPKIKSHTCRIDWKRNAREIRNMIRGLSPTPGAYTTLKGMRLKLFRSVVSGLGGGNPGEIVSVTRDRFGVKCGRGRLEVFDVQLEGKRRMSAREFLPGASLSVGDRLG